MSRLFGRYFELRLGSLRVVGASIKFEIVKTLGREPNTANLRLANLAQSTRDQLATDTEIEVRAGYEDDHDVLFIGDARDVWTERDGPDLWSVIEAEDGGRAYRAATMERSWDSQVSPHDAIAACVEALDIGRGNLATASTTASYAEGLVLSGLAWRQLDRVCRDAGLRWSVQNGNLQLRQSGHPAETSAVHLTPGTGLIGSPKRSKRDARTHRVTAEARSLITPGLYPGRVVVLDSSTVEGNWRINRVRYQGETRGAPWYADLELEEY